MPLQILNITPPAVLKNKELQQELNREGVVQFPFLNADALRELTELYETLHPEIPVGPVKNFYVSTHSSNIDYKLKIESEVRKIIEPACKIYFKQYKLVTSALIIKSPSSESELGIHQDWTVVDELQYASYGLWIPLVDITIENGAIFVLKRSHRIGPTYRHTALPSVYSNIGDAAEKYLVPCEVKAGEAILFNQALLHKSSPNLSQHPRPSTVSTILPEHAPYLMYSPSTKPGNLNAWALKDDYVQRFHSFFEDSVPVPADAVLTVLNVPADFTPLSRDEFENLYKILIHETSSS